MNRSFSGFAIDALARVERIIALCPCSEAEATDAVRRIAVAQKGFVESIWPGFYSRLGRGVPIADVVRGFEDAAR